MLYRLLLTTLPEIFSDSFVLLAGGGHVRAIPV